MKKKIIGGTVEESIIQTPSKIDGSTSRIQESDFEDSPIYTNQLRTRQPLPINDSNTSLTTFSINADKSSKSGYNNEESLQENSVSPNIGDSFQAIKGQRARMRNIIESDSEDELDTISHQKKTVTSTDLKDNPDLKNHRGKNFVSSDSEDESGPIKHQRNNIIWSDSEDELEPVNRQRRNRIQSESGDESEHDSEAEQQNQNKITNSELNRHEDSETSIRSTRSEANSGVDQEEAPEIHNLSDSVVEVDQTDNAFTPSMLRSRIQDLSIQDITSPEDKTRKSNSDDINAIQVVRRSLEQKQSLLKSIKNLQALPDGGTKLKQQVTELEKKLSDLERNQQSSSQLDSNPPSPEDSALAKQEKEDNLRKQIQMKKVPSNQTNTTIGRLSQ